MRRPISFWACTVTLTFVAAAGLGACGGTEGDTDSSDATDEAATGGTSGDADSAQDGGAGGGGGSGPCGGIECPDDDNPCTEDACNPDTNTCGIPRTGNSCDDGLYCNGADTCDEGECTDHLGTPCAGGLSCDEAANACECNTVDDCPAESFSEWSADTYADRCAEDGAKSRIHTTYACNEGSCVATNAPENEAVSRPGPCDGQASTPYCYTSGTECRSCINDGAGTDPGCNGDAPNCCGGTCQSTLCTIINPTIINPTLITTSIINPTVLQPITL